MPSKVDSKQKFLDAFPQILDEIEELCHQYGLNQEAIDWFKEVSDSNHILILI